LKSGLGVIRPADLCTICTSLNTLDHELSFSADSYRLLFSFTSTQKRVSALRSFKVMLGHRNWYHSKAHMQLPTSLPL